MNKVLLLSVRTTFVIYVVAVVYLCFGHIQPPEKLPLTIFGLPIDKCVHFSMFLPFPILSTISFSSKNNFWKTLFWCSMTSFAVAFCLEILQSRLTDYRITDPWDLVANLAGIIVGCVVTSFFSGLVRR